MNKELKTLKDFNEIKFEGDIAETDVDILAFALREEAKKWVKHMEESSSFDEGAIAILEHFFNLEDEE